jgi:hypothetical protein
MRDWLKGGIWGLVVAIIFIISIVLVFTDVTNINWGIVKPALGFFTAPFDFQCQLFSQCSGEGCMVCIILEPILILIEVPILGALIAIIIRKIQSKK